MASEAQRRRKKMNELKQAEEQDDLFDLGDLEGDSDKRTVEDRLTSLRKSPLHLLLMLHSPDFPLSPGQYLYINTSSTDRLAEMRLNGDGTLDSDRGHHRTLSGAAKEWKKDTWKKGTPDGWENLKVASDVKPGRYHSLNEIFFTGWKYLGVELETLENDERLYDHLAGMGLSTQADEFYDRVNKRPKYDKTPGQGDGKGK